MYKLVTWENVKECNLSTRVVMESSSPGTDTRLALGSGGLSRLRPTSSQQRPLALTHGAAGLWQPTVVTWHLISRKVSYRSDFSTLVINNKRSDTSHAAMSMSWRDVDTFLTRRKREEATLEVCSLLRSCNFAEIADSEGGAEEPGGERGLER